MTRRLSLFASALALGLALASASSARADLQYTLSSHAAGSNTFVYSLSFQNAMVNGTPAQMLETYTGSVPGPTVAPRDVNTGSFATLYDIPGLTGVMLTGSSAGLFTFSVQDQGVTPEGTSPDDSSLLNVTLYYTGPATTSDQTFSDVLTIIVNPDFVGENELGTFTGRTTKNTSPAAGTAVDNIGFVTVPSAVPEPSSVILMGLGGLAVLGAGLRRRFARA